MAVTVRDIAKKLNIGKTTVACALSGGPRPVSDEIRLKVIAAAREMGYRPNETARSLAKGRTNIIGVVPFQLQRNALASPFLRVALGAIYDAAEDAKRHVLLFTGYDPRDSEVMRGRFFEARVDGVILLAPRVDHVMLQYIAAQNLPFAVVASPAPGFGLSFNADNVGGVKLAFDHLLALGHRSIAMLSGNPDGGDAKVRHETFLDCATEAGISIASEHIECGEFTINSGYEAGQRLLKAKKRPTAVFVGNDQMAYGLVRACREQNVSIPEDLSIVGFDDDELSAFFPPLTTVHQPVIEMATAALHAVVNLSEGREAVGQVFPTQLIVRASTTSPKED